jgi:tetratricopeptide (TPR) repeat protein
MRIAVVFGVFLLAVIVTPFWSVANEPRETIIQSGLEATARGDYDRALKDFQKIVDKAPADPEGYFFLASVYNVLAGHFEIPPYREGFDKNIGKALSISEAQIKKNPKEAHAYLVAGLTMGMVSMDSVRRKSYLRAFVQSRKTQNYLEKAVELDPGQDDAYYALGLYYYWRVRAKWFKYLAPLIGDTGDQGVQYIQRTAERGKWLRDLARIELVYVLYAEEKFEEARKLLKSIIAQYPEQPHYRFAWAEGYFIEKKYEKAKKEFLKVRDHLSKKKDKVSHLYANFAEWRIVRSDYALKNYPEAGRRALKFRNKDDMGSPLLKNVHKAAERLLAKMNGKALSSVDRLPPPRRYD